MGGHAGVSNKQVSDAIGGQVALAKQGGQRSDQQYDASQAAAGVVNPYYSDLVRNGLPGYRNMTDYGGADIAQAYAPARGQILRSTSQYTNMPSGYRDTMLTQLGAAQGRSFDSTLNNAYLANQQARLQGAAGLQGQQNLAANQALAYAAQKGNANQAIIGDPRKQTAAGALGGAALGVVNSFAQGAGAGMKFA